MQNAGLDESQAGIKISRRNSNNFRYADDTTLRADSEEQGDLACVALPVVGRGWDLAPERAHG